MAHPVANRLARGLELIGQLFGRSTGENERDKLRLKIRTVSVAMALRHSGLPSPHWTSVHRTGSTSFSFPSRQVTRILDEIAPDCGGYPARRSGAGTYGARNAAMGGRAQHSFTIQRPREADVERAHRKLKRSSPRRIPQSLLFSKPVRRSRRCRRLERRLQPRSPAPRAQRHDADRVRRSIQSTPTVLNGLNSDPTYRNPRIAVGRYRNCDFYGRPIYHHVNPWRYSCSIYLRLLLKRALA